MAEISTNYWVGLAYLQLGQKEEAIKCFNLVLEQANNNIYALKTQDILSSINE